MTLRIVNGVAVDYGTSEDDSAGQPSRKRPRGTRGGKRGKGSKALPPTSQAQPSTQVQPLIPRVRHPQPAHQPPRLVRSSSPARRERTPERRRQRTPEPRRQRSPQRRAVRGREARYIRGELSPHRLRLTIQGQAAQLSTSTQQLTSASEHVTRLVAQVQQLSVQQGKLLTQVSRLRTERDQARRTAADIHDIHDRQLRRQQQLQQEVQELQDRLQQVEEELAEARSGYRVSDRFEASP